MTNTRERSEPWSPIALSTMALTDAASPLPRVSSAGSNHVKHFSELFAVDVCGNTTSNRHRSASWGQPEWA